jgi:hypothetical protein
MRHLTIGGSTISRTLACPSWSKELPELKKPAGSAANLGNLMHDAMENYYQKGQSFKSQIGKLKFADLVLEPEHLPILKKALAQTELILDKYDIAEFICEPFVEYLPGEAGGSIDMIGVSLDGETVILIDYKFGRISVPAKNNAQLQFYALCAKTDKKTSAMFADAINYVGVIVQPYLNFEPDEFKFYGEELDYFNTEVDLAISLMKNPRPPTIAGEHCTYCPKNAICDTRRDYAKTAYLLDSKDRDKLAASLPLAIELKSWCDDVIETARFASDKGIKIPGFKRVAGKNLRVWEDQTKAAIQLESDLDEGAYIKKFLSPAQAIKALELRDLPTDIYDSMISFKQSKPLVVKNSDKREEIHTEIKNENLQIFLANKK